MMEFTDLLVYGGFAAIVLFVWEKVSRIWAELFLSHYTRVDMASVVARELDLNEEMGKGLAERNKLLHYRALHLLRISYQKHIIMEEDYEMLSELMHYCINATSVSSYGRHLVNVRCPSIVLPPLLKRGVKKEQWDEYIEDAISLRYAKKAFEKFGVIDEVPY